MKLGSVVREQYTVGDASYLFHVVLFLISLGPEALAETWV